MKTVAEAVAEKAEEAALLGIAHHMENTRSVDALINKSTAKYKLLIKKKSFSIKRGFTVLDEFENRKYVVKTDMLSLGYPCVRLFDTNEKEIGKVKLASKLGKRTYVMYLDGEELGTLSRKMSVKIKLDLSFNGWRLDGNLMQNSFVVYNKNENIIMKFNDAFDTPDTYVLEMNNRENEIIGLLLVMAVEIILHGED
ncbi:MAG: LURP-one-related/scramblase family protein [Oscillospiraceae bacterium]